MVKEHHISVKKASMIFQVPDTTFRDKVLQNVDPETAVFGNSPVLEYFEEANLVQHFKTMAAYGYGYTHRSASILHQSMLYILGIELWTSHLP